jgi:hypothetical protein
LLQGGPDEVTMSDGRQRGKTSGGTGVLQQGTAGEVG